MADANQTGIREFSFPDSFILLVYSAKSRFFWLLHTFTPAMATAKTNQKMHITRG